MNELTAQRSAPDGVVTVTLHGVTHTWGVVGGLIDKKGEPVAFRLTRFISTDSGVHPINVTVAARKVYRENPTFVFKPEVSK